MATVLVYTSSAAGHLYPLMPGLLALRERGHEVHVRTIDKHVQTVLDAGIDAAPVDPRIDAMAITDYKAKSGGERLRRGIVDLIKRGTIQGPDFDRAVEQVEPDVVLVDAINYGAMTRAEALGLSWALFMPSLLPLKGKGIPAYGTGMKPMAGPVGRLRDAAMWKLTERMYGKAILPGLNELRAASGLAPLRSPFDMFEAADRLMITSGEPLEYERTDLPEAIDFVGPQLWDPPAEVPAWLDEPGDPWVLVTCSTDYQGDEELALTAAEALKDEPYRVLITTADAFGGVPPESRGNVRFEAFVPHGLVLERAAGVICHGGMGIVQKALYESVPILVVPFGRDQPEVARRVTEAGAGASLPFKKLSPDRIRDGLREAIANRAGTEAAATRFREEAGTGRFVDSVEKLVPEAAIRASATATETERSRQIPALAS